MPIQREREVVIGGQRYGRYATQEEADTVRAWLLACVPRRPGGKRGYAHRRRCEALRNRPDWL